MKSKNEKPKKRVGRVIGAVALVVLVLIVVVFVAVIVSSPDDTQAVDSQVVQSAKQESDAEPEKLLFAQDGIFIYYLKNEPAPAPAKGHYVWVRIENDSPQDVYVQARDQSVNDIMVECAFSPEVPAGKSGVEYIWFYGLDERRIEQFDCAEFKFEILSTDNYDTIAVSDTIKIP